MKSRIDVLLVERGLAQTREKARRTVMAGLVFADGRICDKPGASVDSEARIEVRGNDCPYVSRGGFKLAKALDEFGISLEGATALDIGASTGGFTDCILQRGAVKVCAVDSGTNQLAWKLRSDGRVVCMERYNFRYADPADFRDRFDFACSDVSFISLKHMLGPAAALMKDGAHMVCLIKPQFEAGREQVGKNGIVRDPAVHVQVIENVAGYAHSSGLCVKGLSFSPIRGAKGNVEYLIHAQKPGAGPSASDARISLPDAKAVVEEAHRALGAREAED